MITKYTSNKYFLRKISHSSSKWADKSILLLKANSVKLNMAPNYHGLLSEEGWQCNAGCTSSCDTLWVSVECESCMKSSLLGKLSWETWMAYLGHLMNHFIIYICSILFSFVDYRNAPFTLYFDYFSKFFKNSAVFLAAIPGRLKWNWNNRLWLCFGRRR